MKCIWLLGQSNMAGRGDISTVLPIVNEKAFMLRDYKWVQMKEPIHTGSGSGIGPGASFAQKFINKYDEPIGLIPCAVGGTSIAQWQYGKPIFNSAVESFKAKDVGDEVIGILWQQGETDSRIKETYENYEQLFDDMLSSLKKETGLCDIPVVLGEIPRFYYDNPKYIYAEKMNKKIKAIADSNALYGFVSSKELISKGDGLHYSSKSYRALGERFFEEFDKIYQGLHR